MTFVPTEENPLLSVQTVAKMFDVEMNTVRLWIRTERVKATKVMGQWRIPKSETIRIANEEYGK